jgi:hypothetical protein
MNARSLAAALAGLLCCGVVGCGSPRFAPVSGRVTLDGQPVPDAVVMFLPVAPEGGIDAPGPGSLGLTNEQGEFTLKVVAEGGPGGLVGEHRVAIAPNTPDGPVRRPRPIPAKYNTGAELRFTVPPCGTTEANFDLTSR